MHKMVEKEKNEKGVILKVIGLFIFVKIAFFFSTYFLGVQIDKVGGIDVVYKAIIFLFILTLLGLLLKRVASKYLTYLWIIVIISMIISYMVAPFYAVLMFISLWFYGLVSSESEVYRLLNVKMNNAGVYLFILSFAPLVINLFFNNDFILISNSIYIAQSAFSWIYSFSSNDEKFLKYQNNLPVFLGIFFILISLVFAFVLEDRNYISYYILAFFIAGNFIINLKIARFLESGK